MKLTTSFKSIVAAASLANLSIVALTVAPALLPYQAIAQTADAAAQAAGIVNRMEQLLGGLNNGQRDGLRQIANTYVRDRGQNEAGARTQFETNLRSGATAEQFQLYQNNREYVLTGKGPRPTEVRGPRTQGEAAGAITNRFEQRFGELHTNQRDAIRQIAETYVRDRGQNEAGARGQFEAGLKTLVTAEQFQQYQSNPEFFLNGRGQRTGGTKTQPQTPGALYQTSGEAAAQGQNGENQTATAAAQAAGIVNRMEQLLGGLNNGQRDGLRQIANTYVRDRGQNEAGARTQFETNLRSGATAEQFQLYQNNREYVLTGKGPRPTEVRGPRTQGEAAGAITNRFEQRFGELHTNQRDAIRQIAETYVRDRGQNEAGARGQFEAGLKTLVTAEQFQQYQSNPEFFLNGRGQRTRR
ncbi:hypothetical protein LJY25_12130 [Hymenobacter sp. BT175]|uniref:hypothetical protein n=1 Tax=Hymenobacter translucens TaxID=2886507 RepID=UPI001D0E1999|nr:hypothetical protein [Hymenobacter translucens]MCC2547198.1 hypothetical protein [Hymenobacter translucens]